MGPAPLRDEAGEPRQQAEVQRHRGRHRPGRRRGRGDAGRARLQRQVLLLPGRRAARTRSPRRAASTPPRTTRTTATASTACSTTRSRAATSARAKPTSIAWRRSASTSSTSAWRRACRSRASTAALLANRSFGGAQVSRTFYARGQTGQQLLLGAYQALEQQIAQGSVKMYPAHRDARPGRRRRPGARHRRARPASPASIEAHRGRRRGAGDGRLRQRLLPVDQRQGLQRHRGLARLQARRRVRQPLLHADPPDLHPGERRPPVQAHADVRVAAQRRPRLGAEARRRQAAARRRSPRPSATTTWSGSTRASATSSPRDIASRAAKEVCDEGRGVGPAAAASTWTSPTPSSGSARTRSRERYGNLFEMYERITDENPYKVPMRIYPAMHYTMGGLWVDYNLMSTIPGLFVLGEANFSDHGANRLGASALMQGLADGYFVLPLHHRQLPRERASSEPVTADHPAVQAAVDARSRNARSGCSSINGQADGRRRSTASWARSCGTTAAWRARAEGSRTALERIPAAARGVLAERRVPGSGARAQPVRSRRPAASPTSWSSPS